MCGEQRTSPGHMIQYMYMTLYMEIHVHSTLAKKVHRGKKER